MQEVCRIAQDCNNKGPSRGNHKKISIVFARNIKLEDIKPAIHAEVELSFINVIKYQGVILGSNGKHVGAESTDFAVDVYAYMVCVVAQNKVARCTLKA